MSRSTLPQAMNFEPIMMRAQDVDCTLDREHDGDAANLEALWSEIFGPGRLAKTAERLREHNQTRFALNRVIRHADRLAGAVRFWPIVVEDPAGSRAPGLWLGPFGIHPQFQGAGLGSRLMNAALAGVRAEGWAFVLLVGDLSYYGRFGFVSLGERVQLPGPVDPERIMGLSLQSPSGPDNTIIPSGKVWRAGHQPAAF